MNDAELENGRVIINSLGFANFMPLALRFFGLGRWLGNPTITGKEASIN